MAREQFENNANNNSNTLYINTENEKDIVTLDEIRQRYIDINRTDEGFDSYVLSGFYDGNVKEYRPI